MVYETGHAVEKKSRPKHEARSSYQAAVHIQKWIAKRQNIGAGVAEVMLHDFDVPRHETT